MPRFRVPLATYRLQFNSGFRFENARSLLPYLRELGASDLYASPRFKARPGSSHGYDVADPLCVNPELGTEQDFENLVGKLKEYGMGLLLDIVPNHMAASADNPWWMDVLENDLESPYAHFFDIDWEPIASCAGPRQETKILLPVLGETFETVLQKRELRVSFEHGAFFINYYDYKLPLKPKSYAILLEEAWRRLGASADTHHDTTKALASLLSAAKQLRSRAENSPHPIRAKNARKQALKRRLQNVAQSHPEVQQGLKQTLQSLSKPTAGPQSLQVLRQLLAEQSYRLAYWKTALEKINYRRFFDISHLVGLRVEDPEVFAARHAEILRLTQENKVTGLRIDHIDGLYDPLGYLRRLQRSAIRTRRAAPQKFYVIAEKILGADEALPADWPVAGTTGYDFLNALNRLFVDPGGLQALERTYARFSGSKATFEEICYSRKKLVMQQLLRAELNALGDHLEMLARGDRRASGISREQLVRAMVELTACLPIYRTYLRSRRVPPRDRTYIESSLKAARSRPAGKTVRPPAWTFLRRLLLLDSPPEGKTKEWLHFVQRWQQFTGPVMAKGLEDTTCYVHNSLVSLNEVGTDLRRQQPKFGLDAFHQFNRERAKQWPYTLNATATHDTKRGEDARARLNVLSEVPEEWERCLHRWSAWNQSKKRLLQGRIAPDRNEEALLYQTLLGAWPVDDSELLTFKERVQAFAVKALREAKVNSHWLNPDLEYETAAKEFIASILDKSSQNPFLPDFLQFQRKLAWYGMVNSLSQLVLKITSPGVPDFYQGAELWDLSLVDPDNRRPVDFRRRVELLEQLKTNDSPELGQRMLAHWQDGRIKQYLIWKGLRLRHCHPKVFLEGAYLPLKATGKKTKHVCTSARCYKKQWVLTAVPRLVAHLVSVGCFPLGKEVWSNTVVELPRTAPRQWTNVLTGEALSSQTHGNALELPAVFRRFPAALLTASVPSGN